MLKTSFTAITAASLLASAGAIAATPTQTFDGLAGSRTYNTDGNVEMNGMSVTAKGRIGGDLEMNGATVDGEAEVGGDLFLNGASVEFTGSVGGAAEVNGAGITLNGDFLGPIEVNAARARLRGRYIGPVELNVGRGVLAGSFSQPVQVIGESDNRNDRSRIIVEGELASGGSICAHEVRFEDGAVLGEVLTVRADSEPVLPESIPADRVDFTDRDGADCD
ncbi:MAG: hypothetical protein AAFX09_01320 [Pseudomonadota bacterium]